MGKKKRKKKKRKEEKEARRLAREEARLAERERELVRSAATRARARARRRLAEQSRAAEEPPPLARKRAPRTVKAPPRVVATGTQPGTAVPAADGAVAEVLAGGPPASPSVPVDAEIVETGVAAKRRAKVVRRPRSKRAPVETSAGPVKDSQTERDEELRRIEAGLDRALRMSADPAAADRAPEVLGQDGERLAGRLGAGGDREPRSASVVDAARELLSSDTYLRVWGRLGMRDRSVEVDEYGLDPKVEAKWRPFFDFLYTTYWRVRTTGVHNIPEMGRCLLVANHSGTIPYDGAMIKTAVEREHPARRKVRWLAEDFVFHFPFLGAFMNRVGAVRACQENADRMLRQERLVAVFPEGIKGIGKLYRERYHLQRFGRGGYVKLVLRTGAPIVPVAVVGAEEIHPLLFKSSYLAQAFGMPYVPITPSFPALGPLGLVPAPTKWLIEFGEPITFDEQGPDAAEDAIVVNRLNDQVRSRIQQMVDRLLAERKSVFV